MAGRKYESIFNMDFKINPYERPGAKRPENPVELQRQITEAKRELDQMKAKIKAHRDAMNDASLKEFTKDIPQLTKKEKEKEKRFAKLRCRRTLKGHLAKVYAMNWAAKTNHLVSASQDGKLLVWDGLTTNKTHAIALRSSWVMTCAYQPRGDFVACGGLDNHLSVYPLRGREVQIKISRELQYHTGYLSCARFLDDSRVITSSGDMLCMMMEIETGKKLEEFHGHDGDVMSVTLSPTDPNVFVSGAIDNEAKLWDIRLAKCVQTFQGHDSDVNSVCYFPSGNAFGTASDDGTCKLFDLRADRELMTYSMESILCGITSVAFSASGRYLFAGYDDYNVIAWDTLRGEFVYKIDAHNNRVSCMQLSHDGKALCTGSWDSTMKIWA
eukprot:TRINITY_DN2046_c0_g1_i1.p1 TRINITY_DN2046_c0_g1~~TRINITY_DN2046_c0_g1_i1.p1  ORF type:complete len:384 (-),score=57.11 TRINITY_DN2046_c0_g1_i1:270-1421(-)